MDAFLARVDAGLTAAFLEAAMLATWCQGRWRGQHFKPADRQAPSKHFAPYSRLSPPSRS